MKKMRKRLIPIVLVLAIIVVVVIVFWPSTSIVGRWQHIHEQEQHMEYFSDGRVQLEDGINTFSGTYELHEDGETIGITMDGMFQANPDDPAIAIAAYSIEEDILTFIQGDLITKFRRVD